MAVLPSISLSMSGMAPCVFHGLTGLPCPLCGGTRSARALLQGDLAHALHLNALAVPAIGLLLLIGVLCVVEAIRGQSFADWGARWRGARVVFAVAVFLLLLWWIPHLWQALKDPGAELLDLRNPIARRLHEAMQAGRE